MELVRTGWNLKSDLWASKGEIKKQTYFIQNFMNADGLEQDRVDACSFMVMTAQGPISMCMHNAKRDDYILEEIKVKTAQGEKHWNPLKGFTNATDTQQKALTAVKDPAPVTAPSI